MAIITYNRPKDIKVSELNRRVKIHIYTSSIDPDTGYDLGSWDAGTEVWGKVTEMNESKEKEITNGRVYEAIIQVIVRYRAIWDSAKIKITYKDKEWEVTNAREVYGKRRFLIFKGYRYARESA